MIKVVGLCNSGKDVVCQRGARKVRLGLLCASCHFHIASHLLASDSEYNWTYIYTRMATHHSHTSHSHIPTYLRSPQSHKYRKYISSKATFMFY